jgi:hypothetical protein
MSLIPIAISAAAIAISIESNHRGHREHRCIFHTKARRHKGLSGERCTVAPEAVEGAVFSVSNI